MTWAEVTWAEATWAGGSLTAPAALPAANGAGAPGDGEGQGERQPGQGGKAGTAPGDGTENAESGTFDAPITGKPGSVSGAITKIENPAGQGTQVKEGSADPKAEGQDRVYVPEVVPGATGTQGQVAAPVGGTGEAPLAPDKAGTGDGSAPDEKNVVGKVTELRTPYKEVLREYAERATQALDNVYIPPDAKKLVRDYFVGLDK